MRRRLSRCRKGISLALGGEELLRQLYAYDGPNTEFSTWKPGLPTDSRHWQCRKREEKTCTPKSYKAKLERLCSTRLTHCYQAVTLLDMHEIELINRDNEIDNLEA
jgi:hypothetical protein